MKNVSSTIATKIAKAWLPEVIQTVSEWAEKRHIMSKFDSPDSGLPWNTAKVPYTKYIMDLFSSPNVRLIVLKWSTQSGKTNLMLNCIGYTMDERPGTMMIVYPTDKTVDRASRTRIAPMINACESLRKKKLKPWSVSEKHYDGGVLYLASSQSGSELSSAPIEVAIGDELKDWPKYTSQGKGSDPVKYLSDRQKQYPYTRKMILVSSPSLEDAPINKHYRSCEAHIFYWVPCPHCGELFRFEFNQIKFGKTAWTIDPTTLENSDSVYWRQAKKHAYYECPHCQGKIVDKQKPKMLMKGRWLTEDQEEIGNDVESIGSSLSSIYSLDLKFGDIAHEFLECSQELEKLMNFKCGWLAEDWKVKAQDLASADILKRKCEMKPGIVPDEAIVLTCGIDVQKMGFYYTVWAWSLNLESWLIDYGFLVSWQDVGDLVFMTQYQRQDGKTSLPIWRAAVDTGGGVADEGWSKTEEIYTWLRGNGRGVAWGIKGISRPNPQKIRHSVIDKMPGKTGQVIPGGVVIFLLDTDKLKEDFFWRLSNTDTDPQPMHFHSETDESYAKHILAEEKRRKKDGSWEWVQVSKDNHYLDASLYAHAAADPQWSGGIKRFARRPVKALPPKNTGSKGGFLSGGGVGKAKGWLGR